MAQFGGSKLVKAIHFDEGRTKLIDGINKLADAVGSTLGASGRTVVIEDDFGNAHVTKDGVTVAESIQLGDPVENLGCTMMKQAARQTATKAGDGTTTSTILAQAIIKEFYAQDGDKESFRNIKSGIDRFAEYAENQLNRRSVTLNETRLRDVARISANNDSKLGDLIADAFIQAGDNGVVTVETSKTNETYVDIVDGTQIGSNYASPHFMTDVDKEICELENPLIFISASKIPNVRKIQDILEYAIKNNRSIFLIASLENQPMTALAMNKVKGNIKVSVAEPPSFGLKQKDLLEDLALLVGATVFDESLGDSLDAISVDMLGSADKVIQDRDGSVIVVENKPEEVSQKVDELQKLVDEEKETYMVNHLKKRLALLCGGVSRIYVGADTEVELKEIQDRVDDAVSAVRAARKGGILPGGGSALFFISCNNACTLPSNEFAGWNIAKMATHAPFTRILQNASLEMVEDYYLLKWGQGVDAIDGKVKDMKKAGIIDPTEVTIQALRNAVSVATTILSTDAVISNVREE